VVRHPADPPGSPALPALRWPGENGQVCGADVAAAYVTSTPDGRLFLDAGTEEGDLLKDTRAFDDTLVKAGHDVTYRESWWARPRLLARQPR
jgi:hypothetical protein